MAESISVTQMMAALEAMCDTIESEKEYLSELDGAIGDGDHGINMSKCFREVKQKLADTEAADINALFMAVGMVVLNSVGGAMGALYGTFFLRLSQETAGKKVLSLNEMVAMFQAGEKGILEIGKANPGDKTLLDTLGPAVRALEMSQKNNHSLSEALNAFKDAAKKGMESTKEMKARIGRASRLGERTIGHQDAGATSCYVILKSLASAVDL